MEKQVHQPVMVKEVLEYLNPKAGGVYVDGTVGAGGHAKALLEALKGRAEVIGLDRDTEILAEAKKTLKGYKHVTLIHASYGQADEALDEAGIDRADGILLDLGASSLQFDRPERGFSFKENGPLDMRFDVSSGAQTAADILNTYRESELAKVIREYGEEPFARRIAKRIVERRKQQPFATTQDLAELVKSAIPKKAWPKSIHPATRTFQALRIEVNHELETLSEALPILIRRLKQGGRIVVISFHSLEDRIVKRAFREAAKDCVCPKEFPICKCDKVKEVKILTTKVVLPTQKELKQNPRARSAKLRAAEHLSL